MTDLSLNETLNRAIADLNDMVATTDGQRELVNHEIAKLSEMEGQVRVQSTLVDSLRTAAQRYGDPGDATPAGDESSGGMNPHLLLSMPRTDAIVWALKQAVAPISPASISEYLTNHGRTNDSPGAVSATLGHLAESGRATSVGRGQWVIGHRESGLTELIPEETYNALNNELAEVAPDQ
jgi:hypothetical protein